MNEVLTEERVTRNSLTKKQVAIILNVCTRTVDRYSHREVDPLPCHKLNEGRPGHVIYFYDKVINWAEKQGRGN